MNSIAQVFATLFIWGASSAMVMAASIQGNVTGFNFVILIAIVMGAAVAGTNFVWRQATPPVVEAYVASEKAKRTASHRLQRVMDSLSEEEIEELRARLSADDEVVPLESLMRRKS